MMLVVDDEPTSLELMAKALRRAGHLVVTTSNGVEAQQALSAARFEVVVTDIFMPEMDGLELIRHICGTSPDTPIIAVSGGSSIMGQGFLPIALALGADVVLRKPVLPRALCQAVEGLTIDRNRRYASGEGRDGLRKWTRQLS